MASLTVVAAEVEVGNDDGVEHGASSFMCRENPAIADVHFIDHRQGPCPASVYINEQFNHRS
jgi:hypothetical protein